MVQYIQLRLKLPKLKRVKQKLKRLNQNSNAYTKIHKEKHSNFSFGFTRFIFCLTRFSFGLSRISFGLGVRVLV